MTDFSADWDSDGSLFNHLIIGENEEGRFIDAFVAGRGDKHIALLGGDPLCLVTELPLYIVKYKEALSDSPGIPEAYLEFKKYLPEIRKRAADGKSLDPILSKFKINHLPLSTAANIQLSILKHALEMLDKIEE